MQNLQSKNKILPDKLQLRNCKTALLRLLLMLAGYLLCAVVIQEEAFSKGISQEQLAEIMDKNIDEIVTYSDEKVLELVASPGISQYMKMALIEAIGERGLEKGRGILIKFVEDYRTLPFDGKIIICPPPAEPQYAYRARIAILKLDFKATGMCRGEYIGFLIDRIKKIQQSDEASIILRSIASEHCMEIGKYLLAEKEDVSLSMVLLNTLAYSLNSYAEPFILDFIRWCRETGRDKNEVSYSYAGVKYSVLIYNNALFALSVTGGRNALGIFSRDIVQDECRMKLTAFLCVKSLINRNIVTIEEAEEAIGISMGQITKDLFAVIMRDLSGSDVRGQKNAADCMSTLLDRDFISAKNLDFRAIKNNLFYLRCQNDPGLRWSGDHLLFMIKIKTDPQSIRYPYRDFSVHFPRWAAISAGVLAIMGVYFVRMVRQPDSGI